MLRVLISCLWLVLLSGCNARVLIEDWPGPEVIELTHAKVLLDDGPRLPGEHDPRYIAVELPDVWSQRGVRASGAYYRTELELAELPRETWGVYLIRLHMNAAVYVNGALIGDGGSMTEPLVRNWNTPLYFTIPPALLHVGRNQLDVRLRTYPGYGWLPPLHVGPERILRKRCELRRFLQIEMSEILAAGLAGLSLFLLGIWWRRRKDAVYLWLAGACLLWALFSAYLALRQPILRYAVVQWIAHRSLDFWIAIFTGFVHRFVGLRRPRLERTLLASFALGSLLTALLPTELRNHAYRLLHGVALATAVYLMAFVFAAWRRQRTRELSLLAGALAFLVLTGLHDWFYYAIAERLALGRLRSPLGHSFYFFHFAAPLVFFAFAWHLTRRFVNAQNDLERMNLELEARVEAGRKEIEESFAARRVLEREQAAAEARERIYRDLHDDLGAKLLSLSIGAETPANAELARGALQDLRDIVSQTRREPTPLSELLADWRVEIERRTQAAALTLHWCEADGLPDPILPSDVALHLGRILRELVSNVIRHARARELRIALAVESSALTLTVTDDGAGRPREPVREGRGLRNLRSRAALLGGVARWQAARPTGWSVEVVVPIERLTTAAAEESPARGPARESYAEH